MLVNPFEILEQNIQIIISNRAKISITTSQVNCGKDLITAFCDPKFIIKKIIKTKIKENQLTNLSC